MYLTAMLWKQKYKIPVEINLRPERERKSDWTEKRVRVTLYPNRVLLRITYGWMYLLLLNRNSFGSIKFLEFLLYAICSCECKIDYFLRSAQSRVNSWFEVDCYQTHTRKYNTLKAQSENECYAQWINSATTAANSFVIWIFFTFRAI